MICKFLGGLLMKKYDTRQRDYLINFLDQHPDQLLSVRQIAQELCSQQISLSAVYRNLSQLEAEGLIRKSIKPGSRHFTNILCVSDRSH